MFESDFVQKHENTFDASTSQGPPAGCACRWINIIPILWSTGQPDRKTII